MKKTAKKLGILSVSLGIVAMSAGCAAKSSETSTGGTSGAGGVVTINYWYQQTGVYADELKKLIQQFNDTHKDIQVKGTFAAANGVTPQKLITAIAAGSAPDATEIDSFLIQQFAAKNAFENLTSYAEASGFNKSDLIPAALDANSYNGDLYAIPHDTDVRFLFWNKDLYKEAGLDPNSPPKTLDDLDNYAEKLTKNTGNNITQAGFIPWSSEGWFYTWAWAYGANFTGENGKIAVNTPQTQQALKWEQSYAKKYGATKLNSFVSSLTQGVDPFITGKVAMEVTGPWNIATIKKQAPNLQYGVTAVPTVDGTGTTWSGGMSNAIPKGTKHAKEAFEFLNWLSQPEQLMEWNKSTAHYPVMNSVISKLGQDDSIIISKDVDTLAAQLLPKTHTRPVTPNGGILWDGMIQAVSKVTNDVNADPAPIMDELEKKVNQ